MRAVVVILVIIIPVGAVAPTGFDVDQHHLLMFIERQIMLDAFTAVGTVEGFSRDRHLIAMLREEQK